MGSKRKSHGRKCYKLTAAHVDSVKNLARKFENASAAEIATLSGFGRSTVEKILSGGYDYLYERRSDGKLCPVLNDSCAEDGCGWWNGSVCAISLLGIQ